MSMLLKGPKEASGKRKKITEIPNEVIFIFKEGIIMFVYSHAPRS